MGLLNWLLTRQFEITAAYTAEGCEQILTEIAHELYPRKRPKRFPTIKLDRNPDQINFSMGGSLVNNNHVSVNVTVAIYQSPYDTVIVSGQASIHPFTIIFYGGHASMSLFFAYAFMVGAPLPGLIWGFAGIWGFNNVRLNFVERGKIIRYLEEKLS